MPCGRMGIHCIGSFDTGTGAMVVNGIDGGAMTYDGVGLAHLDLDRPLDVNDMCLLATPRNAALRSIQYANNTDTQKDFVIRDGAVGLGAAESGIDFAILKVSAIDRKLILAAGAFAGSLAGGAVAICERGAAVARTNVGIYTITLDRPIDQRECVVMVTPGPGAAAATDLHPRVVHTSDTVKTVTIETLAAGADVDADFSWAVFSMLNAPDVRCYGIGSIDAAGGNPVGRGCLPARNGAGDYRYAVDLSSGPGGWAGLATIIGATGHTVRTVNAAVGRKDVETQIQAAAAQNDSDHGLVLLRIA